VTPISGTPVPGPTPEPSSSLTDPSVFYHPSPNPDNFAPSLPILTFWLGHSSWWKNERLGDGLVEKVAEVLRGRLTRGGDEGEKMWRNGVVIDTTGEWVENKEKGWERVKKAVSVLDGEDFVLLMSPY
jgi:polyribonucleotide 5'-hydroxyl-kinase